MELKQAIDKKGVRECGKLRGLANTSVIVLGQKSFGAGELVYLGFVGSGQPDGLFHGVHRFAPNTDKDCRRGNFSALFQVKSKGAKP